jgi:U2 small nuclear ribonucleoprotein A'
LMTGEEREKIRKAIGAAESVAEVRRLERLLAEGHVPEEEKKKEKEKKEGEKEGEDEEKEE